MFTDREARNVADVLIFSISVARTVEDLAVWWRGYQHIIRALPEHERNRVIAAKDRRKEELNAHPDEASQPRPLSRAG